MNSEFLGFCKEGLIIRKFLCCASGAAFKCGVKNSKNKIVGGTETEVQPHIYIYLY